MSSPDLFLKNPVDTAFDFMFSGQGLMALTVLNLIFTIVVFRSRQLSTVKKIGFLLIVWAFPWFGLVLSGFFMYLESKPSDDFIVGATDSAPELMAQKGLRNAANFHEDFKSWRKK